MTISAEEQTSIPPGKEPWLAVNLSMLFPGIGQIYAGKTLRGWILVISQLVAQVVGFAFMLLPQGNISVGLGLLLLSVVITFGNLFDAHRCARLSNSEVFEQHRKSTKDPWLAVLLSRFLPGLGFFYIRRWFIGILLFILTFLTLVIPALSLLGHIAFPLIIFGVYQAAPIRRERKIIAILCVCLFPVVSLFIALMIRAFIAEARYIPAGSMEPALQINDRLVIDKLSYFFTQPGRGDIVVFNPTQALQEQGFDSAFIKRIVGIPGDRIEIKDGAVWINNTPLQEPYVANGDDTTVDLCSAGQSGLQPFLGQPQVIPPDRYVVLGDNRHNSYDSRCWGLVSRDEIVGRATKRFWPPGRMGPVTSGLN